MHRYFIDQQVIHIYILMFLLLFNQQLWSYIWDKPYY